MTDKRRFLIVGNPSFGRSLLDEVRDKLNDVDVIVCNVETLTNGFDVPENPFWPEGFPDLRKELFDHEVQTAAQEIDDSVQRRFPDVDWDMVKRQMSECDPLTADEFRKIHMCEPLPYEPERQNVPSVHRNRPQQGHIRKFRK